MIYSPSHWQTSVAERENSAATYAQAKAAKPPINLPLVVLTTENGWKAWRTSDEAGRVIGCNYKKNRPT